MAGTCHQPGRGASPPAHGCTALRDTASTRAWKNPEQEQQYLSLSKLRKQGRNANIKVVYSVRRKNDTCGKRPLFSYQILSCPA